MDEFVIKKSKKLYLKNGKAYLFNVEKLVEAMAKISQVSTATIQKKLELVTAEDENSKAIVISDMEIDGTGNNDWTFYNEMKRRFEEKGYDIPNIIFWNVKSRHDVFHADKNRMGVQLCSGQSVTTFKQLMSCVGASPVEMMERVINSERYSCITVNE